MGRTRRLPQQQNTEMFEGKKLLQSATMTESKLSKDKTKGLSYQIEEEPRFRLKVMPTKFIAYLDKLSASISICKDSCMGIYRMGSKLGNFSDSSSSRSSVILKSTRKQTARQQYEVQVGETVNGKLEGFTKVKFRSGAYFEGQMENGALKEGTLTFLDGSEYRGPFKASLFHGQGQLTNANGTKYIGLFRNGSFQKNGMIKYDNGDIYTGEILNYRKHGQGQLKLSNGNRFAGEFTHGEITGYGSYYSKDALIAEGRWKNGEFLQETPGFDFGRLSSNSEC